MMPLGPASKKATRWAPTRNTVVARMVLTPESLDAVDTGAGRWGRGVAVAAAPQPRARNANAKTPVERVLLIDNLNDIFIAMIVPLNNW